MSKLKATEVFTPGSFPVHTYVERADERLEQTLRDALSTPGQVVSLSGPSKSGKTVLVERVVGRDSLITVTGAGVRRPEDLWERVLDWMDVPHARMVGSGTSQTLGAEVGIDGSVQVPLFAKASAEAKASLEGGRSRSVEGQFSRRGLTQVVDEIAGSDFVILVDDFHYMHRDMQIEAARILKEAVRLGVKVCTASVRHRGDDVVRANPELRGRVKAVDLNYWVPSELIQIATAGMKSLGIELPAEAIKAFAAESAGSPQLMQLICLNACFVTGAREQQPDVFRVDVPRDLLYAIFEQTSSSTDFRSLVDVLDSGPKTRGTERRTYPFRDGSKGDVYRCILKAVAADPPRLSFDYERLTGRASEVCDGDVPLGSSIVSTCLHMSRLAQENFPNERAIDWDDQTQILDIPDPYLLFFLRWSGRLKEE